jgi:hypothetical protein
MKPLAPQKQEACNLYLWRRGTRKHFRVNFSAWEQSKRGGEREKLILIWLVLVPLQRRRHGGAQSFASSVIYLAQKVFSASESVLGAHTLGLYGAPHPLRLAPLWRAPPPSKPWPGILGCAASKPLARPPAPCAAELSHIFL